MRLKIFNDAFSFLLSSSIDVIECQRAIQHVFLESRNQQREETRARKKQTNKQTNKPKTSYHIGIRSREQQKQGNERDACTTCYIKEEEKTRETQTH